MSGVLSALSGQSGGAGPAKCVDVVFSPPFGTTPLTVGISTTTPNAHIFYAAKGNTPTHTGDSAGPNTIRVGSNSGSINVGAGTHTYQALAYEPSHLDSDISGGDYDSGGGM